MNILVTLNRNYLRQLKVLIHSMLLSNPEVFFDFYVISKDLTDEDLEDLQRTDPERLSFNRIHFDDALLEGAPTSSRYPLEIYYRLFAAKILPESVKKILYLDPDIVVINSLKELYATEFDGAYFVGATHVRNLLRKFNRLRCKAKKNAQYLNTGVLLMNVEKLREEQDVQEVYDFIDRFRFFLALPDQDIIFGLYGDKVKLVDYLKYNLSDRMLLRERILNRRKYDVEWVRKNSVIIHYFGRNKPWKRKYRGILDVFYKEIEAKIAEKEVAGS
ncbi:MAG TPA: glycosyltransferase family 8 protein [Acholeplasmataceae bacterium]|nr:glycosyltransferase family 8 protein [Acholeplasmataceae bacterium]